jgi:DNA-binding MarR family transcriptional regulator
MPTLTRRPSTDVVELASALERTVVALRRAVGTPEISLTAASTLGMLERQGPYRLSELAVAQGVTQPAMTQLVTRLEREELARRGGSPDDARVVLVNITPAGRALLRRRRTDRANALARLMDELDSADRAALFAAAPALTQLAEHDERSTTS